MGPFHAVMSRDVILRNELDMKLVFNEIRLVAGLAVAGLSLEASSRICKDGLRFRTFLFGYLATLACEASMPGFSNSPRMHGAP